MNIQDVVLRLKKILIQNNWTIATAESLTAGLVSSYLASVSGSSGYLKGGIAAYTIPIKAKLLGVDEKMAEACNAYSAKVARQMAHGVCKSFDSNIGISTTGYAEPSPDDNIEVPQAYVAISIDGKVHTLQIFAHAMSRNHARGYIAEQALIFLLDTIEAGQA